MPKIVYLEAQGTGTFRSRLRSDTLWGSLCWCIRMLQDAKGTEDMSKLMAAYGETEGPAFYLSSAFPWYATDTEERVHYLPFPMIEPVQPEFNAGDLSPSELKNKARVNKETNKKPTWISWQNFSVAFGSGAAVPRSGVQPVVKNEAVTHNLVDRRRLGTMTSNEQGQLFHMNENYVEWKKSKEFDQSISTYGFYFLLDGDDSLVLPALRLLSTLGIGGDRNNGKGNFKIYWENDAHDLPKGFSLPKVENANSALNLSLYYPSEDRQELRAFDQVSDSRWQYQLEDRQGRNFHQGDYLQTGRLFFKEGSVFPKEAVAKEFPGQNVIIGTHQRYGHPIYRYGHAFLLDINVK